MKKPLLIFVNKKQNLDDNTRWTYARCLMLQIIQSLKSSHRLVRAAVVDSDTDGERHLLRDAGLLHTPHTVGGVTEKQKRGRQKERFTSDISQQRKKTCHSPNVDQYKYQFRLRGKGEVIKNKYTPYVIS